MELLVERKWCKPDYTIGRLYIDGEFFSNTLEDRIVDVNKNGVFDGNEKKDYAESAIPYGRYQVIYNWSPKFGRNMPRLLNVPHFDGILFHSGNTAKDSAGPHMSLDWKTPSEAALCTGELKKKWVSRRENFIKAEVA